MGPLSRPGGVHVAVTPEVVRPRQTVTATVTTELPVDRVATATLEWGYDNFYRFHWAGQPGVEFGSDRDGDDWVCVTRVELPVAMSEFTGATATFKIPSWAPGSSPQIARWSCRLRIERAGHPIDVRGEFVVVVGADDVEAVVEPLELVSGDGVTAIDVVLGSPLYRSGETVRGEVVLRPTIDLPDGNVAVFWQRQRESHPLARPPADDVLLDGRILELGKRTTLRQGIEVTLPFALALPGDAAPTASAVHSSLSWFVAARMIYAGFTGHGIELVRRPITVVDAS